MSLSLRTFWSKWVFLYKTNLSVFKPQSLVREGAALNFTLTQIFTAANFFGIKVTFLSNFLWTFKNNNNHFIFQKLKFTNNIHLSIHNHQQSYTNFITLFPSKPQIEKHIHTHNHCYFTWSQHKIKFDFTKQQWRFRFSSSYFKSESKEQRQNRCEVEERRRIRSKSEP